MTAGNARESAKQHAAEQRENRKQERWKASVEDCKAAIEAAMRSIPGHQEVRSVIESRSGKGGRAFNEALAFLLRTGRMSEAKIVRANGHEYDGLLYHFDTAA